MTPAQKKDRKPRQEKVRLGSVPAQKAQIISAAPGKKYLSKYRGKDLEDIGEVTLF